MRIVRFAITRSQRSNRRAFSVLCALIMIAGCSPESDQVVQRWYSQHQVEQGAEIFQSDCASCHGDQAQSTPDWKKPGARGNYPAPPLDGSAHAWHHDLSILRRTINIGGIPLGGTMPAFKGKLSDLEQDAVIAYFQSLWPEDTYRKWADRFIKE